MNTNLPTFDNANGMIEFLKSFSTADALRDCSFNFYNYNFTSLYDGEKLPGIGVQTLSHIGRCLTNLCELISPAKSVAYENQYFQIQNYLLKSIQK